MATIRQVALVSALLIAPILEARTQVVHPRPPFAPRLPGEVRAGTPLTPADGRSGPRFGVAYVVGGSVTAEQIGRHVAPVMTLFGWQLEHQFQTGSATLPVPMTELVVLVGGMEQGAFLPSASWLVGVRKPSGWEVGAGPMLTGAGLQIVAAAGVTHSFGALNVPMNLAVAPGRRGASISVTTGFNVKRRP